MSRIMSWYKCGRNRLNKFIKHNTWLEDLNSNRVFTEHKASMLATAPQHSAPPAHQLVASHIIFSWTIILLYILFIAA
jgi:hypothetical protein